MSDEKESTPAPEENEAASEPQEEASTPEPEAQAEEPKEEEKAPEPEVKEEEPVAEEPAAEEKVEEKAEEAPEASAEDAKEEEALAPEAKEEEPAAEEKAEETSKAEEPKEEKAEAKEEKKAEPKAKEEPKADAEASSEEAAEGEEEKPAKKEETAEDLLKSELAEVKIRRAKGSKNITHGIVHVMATFNNTKVNITDMKGNTISWSSSGKCNFRGSRKSTAYAAQVVTMDAGRVAMSHGLKEVVVKVCGPGMGRDSAVRALQSLGLNISSIVDVTPVPHNGCRPPKRRRV